MKKKNLEIKKIKKNITIRNQENKYKSILDLK